MSYIEHVAALSAQLAADENNLRRNVARYAQRPDANIAGLARAANISRQTLYTWANDYNNGKRTHVETVNLKGHNMNLDHLEKEMSNPTFAVLGETAAPAALPLSEGSHWLLVGQTGSGKSNFINGLLTGMMEQCTPDELNIFWVDPKKVEARQYKGTPFCPIDPVVDMGDAYGLIEYLHWETDRRFDMMEKTNTRSIEKYNTWIKDNPETAAEKGLKSIPYIVTVIDEYADMVTQTPQVDKSLVKLTARSGVCGIHLIVASQRPSATIFSANVKANLPARICMRVADEINSRVVIDQPGGEKLRGYGDMLFKDKTGQVTRLQASFTPEEKIQEVCENSISQYGAPVPIDYKKIVVDNGSCQWVGGGGEPHVKPND